MPDINNKPLKILKGCVLIVPDPTDPQHEYDNKHGTIRSIWPDNRNGLAEVVLDNGDSILVDGYKLILDEVPRRKRFDD